MSTRDKQHLAWAVSVGAVLVLVYAFGFRVDGWQGPALWITVASGQAAARYGERRRQEAQTRHHHAAALRSAAQGMEDAAAAHGSHGVHGTLTYGQAATILRDVAASREQDQPPRTPRRTRPCTQRNGHPDPGHMCQAPEGHA